MDNKSPDIIQQASNLVSTAKDVAVHVVRTGSITASKEESDRRLSVCDTCEMYDKEKSRCNKCGCFMKSKVLFIAATCPLNKW